MSRLVSLAVFVALIGLVGCALFQVDPVDDAEPVEQKVETPQEHVAETVEGIQQLRDRQFEPPPRISEGEPPGFDPEPVPESVAEEWEWFEEFLFGGHEAPLVADDPAWADRIGIGDDGDELIFKGDPRTDEATAFAVAMGASKMLEHQGFSSLANAETVDEWMAAKIISRAGPAFGSSILIAEQFGVELDIADLAERPELAAHVPGVGDGLERVEEHAEMTEVTEPPEGTDFFEEALTQFVLRKSLTVGSALYRSGGWPAVEWGRSEPPAMSDLLVHPETWFEGAGGAEWSWPEPFDAQHEEDGWTKLREGRVGPAVTSLWLEGLVGPRAARTIYGGWRADAYRIYAQGEGEDKQQVFHWVSAWETPHDAQEIASAIEPVLGHYLGHEHREQRFRVAADGLTVAVSIYDTDQDIDQVNHTVEMLAGAGPGFMPGEAAPFEYEPPLYERYVRATEDAKMDLDSEEWTDPAAGWHTDIASLEGWTVQRSDEAHVRWFANHPDGTLIQWTTELVDPTDAPFGSEEYLDELAGRFAESVDAEEQPDVAIVDEPVEDTVRLQVSGRIGDRPQELELWQWKRGDVLVSFSIQGPEGFFGERRDEAMAVLNSLHEYGDAIEQRDVAPEPDPTEDDGIIEFEVGEE